MRFPLLFGVCLLLAATRAQAGDPRLATHAYNPDEVVQIPGRAGVQTIISFGKDEHIENVAIGDASAWQVTPNRRADLLFVKPLGRHIKTNLTVVTDRHTYYFDLRASPGAAALYRLKFTYPDEPKAPSVAKARPDINASEAGIISGDPLALPVDPATLNFAWEAHGDAALLPRRVFDDGKSTYLTWKRDGPLPAILVRNEEGVEGPVNYVARGDVIVLDGVPARIVLRLGRDHADLENKGAPLGHARGKALTMAQSAEGKQ